MIDFGATSSCITLRYFKSSSILFSLTTAPYKGTGILLANSQNLIPLFSVTLTSKCGSLQFENVVKFLVIEKLPYACISG